MRRTWSVTHSVIARYAACMQCPRCAAEMTGPGVPWCRDCEKQYDTWVRKRAADIIWQTGLGALVAMAIGLALPLLGLEPIIGIAGVLVGFTTFMGLRTWGKKRRRRQFLTD